MRERQHVSATGPVGGRGGICSLIKEVPVEGHEGQGMPQSGH